MGGAISVLIWRGNLVGSAEGTCDQSNNATSAGVLMGLGERVKDHVAIPGKEDKNRKGKSKPDEPLAAEPAS
jgi:hypothetical protein